MEKSPNFFWVNQLFRLGHFQSFFVCLLEGIGHHAAPEITPGTVCTELHANAAAQGTTMQLGVCAIHQIPVQSRDNHTWWFIPLSK